MTRRAILATGLLLLAAAAAAAAYLHGDTPPACASDRALDRVYATLHDRFHFESIFLNDIRTVSGGFFGQRYDCSAEAAELRGNIAASSMRWREVHYRIVHQSAAPYFAVSVELGGDVPLAPPGPKFWTRVRNLF